jgi:hypothetical protein
LPVSATVHPPDLRVFAALAANPLMWVSFRMSTDGRTGVGGGVGDTEGGDVDAEGGDTATADDSDGAGVDTEPDAEARGGLNDDVCEDAAAGL